MAISTLGSGIDIPSLVAQLVAAERSPVENRIARGENAAKTELSAIGSLKSAFSNLKTALDKLRKEDGTNARVTNVPEDAGFTASAGTTAAVGEYDIQVLELATAHKLTSAGKPADTKIGTGTLVIEAGDETIEVTIEEGRNIYTGLAKFGRERGDLIAEMERRIASDGALAASDIGGERGIGGWWGWSEGKAALEWLFWAGRITARERKPSFERIYDLPERVIPQAIRDLPVPDEADAIRQLGLFLSVIQVPDAESL